MFSKLLNKHRAVFVFLRSIMKISGHRLLIWLYHKFITIKIDVRSKSKNLGIKIWLAIFITTKIDVLEAKANI